MKRVTGLGGVFFKCKDPDRLKKWYETHLGIGSDEHGGMFTWRDPDHPARTCITAWGPFTDTTGYFEPSEKPFMFNYRVENLTALLEVLRGEGVTVVGSVEEFEYGKFGWIMDPEGNKIELWEPIDEPLLRGGGG
jgi:predicted enzyme related to lactoylglutathione lyase